MLKRACSFEALFFILTLSKTEKKLTQIRGKHMTKMLSGFTINLHLFSPFGSKLLKVSKK